MLAEFLADVVGFNVISDEAVRGPELPKNRVPSQWPWKENPPDVYFNYYVWANMYSLNRYREQKGLGTFTYRPTCEMGDPSQLVSGYLLANSINHALRMVSNPVLHYLYYMKQIGIVSSPLGNNGLSFTRYADNPFPMYLKQVRAKTAFLRVPSPECLFIQFFIRVPSAYPKNAPGVSISAHLSLGMKQSNGKYPQSPNPPKQA